MAATGSRCATSSPSQRCEVERDPDLITDLHERVDDRCEHRDPFCCTALRVFELLLAVDVDAIMIRSE